MYLSERVGNRVRIIFKNGTIATYAGNGQAGTTSVGNGGPATSAKVYGTFLLYL